jgi:hypothetical protein
MGVSDVLEHPLRVVGLALVCAMATATLTMVTFVVSSLVLSVIAVLGPAAPASAMASDGDAVQGVLLSGEQEPAADRCRGAERTERSGTRLDQPRADRCAGQRHAAGAARP